MIALLLTFAGCSSPSSTDGRPDAAPNQPDSTGGDVDLSDAEDAVVARDTTEDDTNSDASDAASGEDTIDDAGPSDAPVDAGESDTTDDEVGEDADDAGGTDGTSEVDAVADAVDADDAADAHDAADGRELDSTDAPETIEDIRDVPTPDLGCTSDDECIETLEYCDDGTCLSKLGLGETCGDPRVCLSGICADRGEADAPTCVCGDHDDCPGAFCDVATGACVTCLDDTACDATAEYCESGACVDKQPLGEPCDAPRVCLSGACEDLVDRGARVCVCKLDDDCGDAFCDVDTGACVECLEHGSCASSEYCDGGECTDTLPLGAPCSDARSCTSDACSVPPDGDESVCLCDDDADCAGSFCDLAAGACVECLADEACHRTEFCGAGACADKLALGEGCARDAMCASDACSEPSGGDASVCICTSHEECDGAFCDPDSGACVECLDDSACDDVDFCADDHTCQPRAAVGEPCASDLDCASRMCDAEDSADEGTCRCGDDDDCPALCDTETGLCTGCATQRECPEFNKYCDVGGTWACRSKKPTTAPCNHDYECLSGACRYYSPTLSVCR